MLRLLHWTMNPINHKNKDFIIFLNISISPGSHNLKSKKSIVSCNRYFQVTLLSLPFLPSMLVFPSKVPCPFLCSLLTDPEQCCLITFCWINLQKVNSQQEHINIGNVCGDSSTHKLIFKMSSHRQWVLTYKMP